MLRIQHLLLLIFGISTSSAYYSCSDDNTDSFTDLINSKDNLEDLLEVAKDASANMSAAIKDWQKEVTDDDFPLSSSPFLLFGSCSRTSRLVTIRVHIDVVHGSDSRAPTNWM